MKKLLLTFFLFSVIACGSQADTVYTVTTGFGAGGSSTNIIHFLFSKMPDKTVVFERHPGADGVVAANHFKNTHVPAKHPNQCTDLFLYGLSSAYVMSDILYPGQREYSPDDFKTVISLGRAVTMLVASPSSKSNTVKDMQERVANGESLSLGHMPGIVRAWAIEFSDKLGGRRAVQPIPYKSAAQIGQDVMGGHVEFALLNGSAAYALYKQGLIKIIGVINDKRINGLDVPTIAEALPNFGEGVDTTIVLSVPKGTNDKCIDELNTEFKSVMLTQEGQAMWATNQIYFDTSDLNRRVVKVREDRILRSKEELTKKLK